MKPEISDLQRQIQKNCDISDARYAGVYSLCGLLLRMRDLYKWEHRMVPWQEPEAADLMGWMEDREQYWEEIIEGEIAPVVLGADRFDPYDMTGLNVRLRPLGLVYGAGYGIGMKPTFFLAECAESRSVDGLRIDVVNRELARDIFMTPAMRRGEQIFARRSCMLFFLWDHFFEALPSAREALEFGLARYGVGLDEIRRNPARLGDLLERIAGRELETWVYHEIGEVLETGFDSGLWQEMVSAYANTPGRNLRPSAQRRSCGHPLGRAARPRRAKPRRIRPRVLRRFPARHLAGGFPGDPGSLLPIPANRRLEPDRGGPRIRAAKHVPARGRPDAAPPGSAGLRDRQGEGSYHIGNPRTPGHRKRRRQVRRIRVQNAFKTMGFVPQGGTPPLLRELAGCTR